jgi:hypothetical protein
MHHCVALLRHRRVEDCDAFARALDREHSRIEEEKLLLKIEGRWESKLLAADGCCLPLILQMSSGPAACHLNWGTSAIAWACEMISCERKRKRSDCRHKVLPTIKGGNVLSRTQWKEHKTSLSD